MSIVDVTAIRGAVVGPDLIGVHVRNAAPTIRMTVNGSPAVAPTREALTRPDAFSTEARLWAPVPASLTEHTIVVFSLGPSGSVIVGSRCEWHGSLFSRGSAPRNDRITAIARAIAHALRTYATPDARIAIATTLEDRAGGVRMLSVADTPALTLSAPSMTVARLHTPAKPIVDHCLTSAGVQRIEAAAPLSVDLCFMLTGTARNASEALGLMAAVSTFIARTRWIEVHDATRDGAPLVRWDLDGDSFSSEVAAGVHLFRALLRVRDVAMPWPASEARAA